MHYRREYAIVWGKDKNKDPYPYVFVESNRSYRELEQSEKEHLQERFDPLVGNRPYIKSKFYSKSPDGDFSGFLKRSKLPEALEAGVIAPSKPWWKIW